MRHYVIDDAPDMNVPPKKLYNQLHAISPFIPMRVDSNSLRAEVQPEPSDSGGGSLHTDSPSASHFCRHSHPIPIAHSVRYQGLVLRVPILHRPSCGYGLLRCERAEEPGLAQHLLAGPAGILQCQSFPANHLAACTGDFGSAIHVGPGFG